VDTSPAVSEPPETSPPDLEARLALAKQAFSTYYTRCFWSLSPDAAITAETLPNIVSGLRRHGGRAGFKLAAQLCQ
jgi:hypothetical protein